LGRSLREEKLLEARNLSLNQIEIELADKNKEVKNFQENLVKLKEEKEKIGEIDDKGIFERERELYQIGSKEIKELEEKKTKLVKKVEEEEKLVEKLKNELFILEERQKQHRKNLALELASTLKEGEPCMVCGSLHHPNIAHGSLLEEDFSEVYDRLIEVKSKLGRIDLEEKREEIRLLEEKLAGRSYAKALEMEKEIKAKIEEIKKANKELVMKNEKYTELIKEAERKKDIALREQIGMEERKISWEEEKQNTEGNLIEIKKELGHINISYLVEDTINYEIIKKEINQSEEKYMLFEKYGKSIEQLEKEMEKYRLEKENFVEKIKEIEREIRTLEGELVHMGRLSARSMEEFERALIESNFESVEEIKDFLMEEREKLELEDIIDNYKKSFEKCRNSIEMLEGKIGDRKSDRENYIKNVARLDELKSKLEENKKALGKLTAEKERMEKIKVEVEGLMKAREKEEKELDKYEDLSSIFEGNKFVEFLALGKIRSIAKNAGQRLENISGGRYGLETDRDGNFLIVDNFNGGEMRKSPTLSGGESFLVSLSLALALSSQIQLKGQAQLEFFFLDEGFGTLDIVLLDKVMTSLEKLKSHEGLKVGIISHVEELKDRVPRKVEINPPISGEKGSIVRTI
jgi:exonuclease SbcC